MPAFKGYLVAELRLIFRAQPTSREHGLNDWYAFVHWFSPMSSPIAPQELRRVNKLICYVGRQGGVIPLSDIKAPCPLYPILPNPLTRGMVGPDNSMDLATSFYLAPFISHLEYRTLV